MEKAVRLLAAAGVLMLLAGGDFWVYAAMDLRGPAPGRCVRLPDCGAEFPEPEKQGIVRV